MFITTAPQSREDAQGWEGIRKAIDYWFRRQSENPCRYFYWYYSPSAGAEPGRIAICEDDSAESEAYKLASPKRISPAHSTAQVFNQIRDVWENLPVLATE